MPICSAFSLTARVCRTRTEPQRVDPDASLVRRARRGDRHAFGELVERHQARLFTLAVRSLGNEADAADAVQEAFLRAWVALPRFREGALFSTWLYRICLNAAHDQRSRRRTPTTDVAPDVADPRDPFVASELSGSLQRALDDLDEDFRLAVVLYDILGCPYSEIAELTGVAEGTVKSRIHRGRTELARRLGTGTADSESNDR
jgi:RNA polymerase sigma-70 factor (ECF subfamily)